MDAIRRHVTAGAALLMIAAGVALVANVIRLIYVQSDGSWGPLIPSLVWRLLLAAVPVLSVALILQRKGGDLTTAAGTVLVVAGLLLYPRRAQLLHPLSLGWESSITVFAGLALLLSGGVVWLLRRAAPVPHQPVSEPVHTDP